MLSVVLEVSHLYWMMDITSEKPAAARCFFFSSVFLVPGLNSDETIFEADFGGPFPVPCWSAVLFVAGYLALLVAGFQLLKSREWLSCRTKLLSL